MIKSASFSLRIKPTTKKRLEDLAHVTQWTKSFIAETALESYLDVNEWQIVEAIKEANDPNAEWTDRPDVKAKWWEAECDLVKKKAEILALQRVKEAEIFALQLVKEATTKALQKAEGIAGTSEEALVSARRTVGEAEVLAHQSVEKAKVLVHQTVNDAETLQAVKVAAEVARLKVIKGADIARLTVLTFIGGKQQEEKILAARLVLLQKEMLILQDRLTVMGVVGSLQKTDHTVGIAVQYPTYGLNSD